MRKIGFLAVVGVLAACGGKSSSLAVHALLTRAVSEPAGTHCAQGGVAIQSGTDVNDDGKLEDVEVDSTSYVCSGANGAAGASGSCTIADGGAGTQIVSCSDGTRAVLHDGQDGSSAGCSVRDGGGGAAVIDCGDGGTAVVASGASGASGSSCTVTDNGDGTQTIDCGDGGSATVTNGANGAGCTVTDAGAGSALLDCGDGGAALISSGANGQGASCSVTSDADAGTSTITCSNGTTATVSNGASGANGQTTLIVTSTESPGPNCPYGGTRVESGLDANGNGTLDASEVASIQYVCNGAGANAGGTLQGSYTIHNSLDVALLGGYTAITGDLNIDAAGLTAVSLPNLTSIGGYLGATQPDLQLLQLPALTSVKGLLLDTSALTALDLSSLQSASDYLTLINVTALDAVSLPALSDTASLTIYGSGTTSVSLPALAQSGFVDLGDVGSVSLDALATVSGLRLIYSSATTLSLPALTSAGTLDFEYDSAMTSVNLPLFAGAQGTLIFGGDTQLASLSLPAVTSLSGDLNFLDLPALTSVDLSGLQSVAGTLTVSGLASMTSLSIPTITSVGALEVGAAPKGFTLQLDGVTSCGPMEAQGNDDVTISLANLASAGNVVVDYNPGTVTFNAPLLTRSGDLTVTGNSGMQSFTFPGSLGNVTVTNNAALQTLTLSGPGSCGDITFGGAYGTYSNPALTTLNLGFTTAGEIDIDNYQYQASIQTLFAPNLQTVSSILALPNGTLPALTTLDMPALITVTGSLMLYDTELTGLSLPQLQTVDGQFYVASNAALPQCQVDALFAQLTSSPSSVYDSGNSSTCP